MNINGFSRNLLSIVHIRRRQLLRLEKVKTFVEWKSLFQKVDYTLTKGEKPILYTIRDCRFL
jgi:hypothetical protein